MSYHIKWAGENHRSKRYCPWGHDKAIVGVTYFRRCSECDRHAKQIKKRAKRRRNPYSKTHAAFMQNLKSVRIRMGLTQDELATMSGLTRPSISRIENQRMRAIPTSQEKILNALMEAKRRGNKAA